MENNIFEPPSSQVSDPVTSHADRRKHVNYAFYAFFLSPLVTVLLAMLLTIVLGLVFEGTETGVFHGALKLAAWDSYLLIVSFLYFTLFVFGLSTHWLLGKLTRRKLYLYLLMPALIPSPILLLGMDVGVLTVWASLAGLLAVCFSVFWTLAVYLPRTRTL